jgi:predicted ATPase
MTTVRLWLPIENAPRAEDTASMEEAVRILESGGQHLFSQVFLGLVAAAHVAVGAPEKGAALLSEALATIEPNGQYYYEAELYRIHGEVLLARDPASVIEAEACFLRAIEVARRQSAKAFELRAVTSLARLLRTQGKRSEARSGLAEIYAWFTEGFDTADMKDAKALLEELS